MWTQDPEHGERSCMTEYRSLLGFEEGTRQNCLVSSCSHGHTLAWNLQMTMMTMFMTTFKMIWLEIHFGISININKLFYSITEINQSS